MLPKNPLFRLLLINAFFGVVAAVIVVAGLYWFNVGDIQRLSSADQTPWVPVIMLIVMFIITLGSAAMGAAIMGLPSDDDKNGGKKQKARHHHGVLLDSPLVPVAISAGQKRRRLLQNRQLF